MRKDPSSIFRLLRADGQDFTSDRAQGGVVRTLTRRGRERLRGSTRADSDPRNHRQVGVAGSPTRSSNHPSRPGRHVNDETCGTNRDLESREETLLTEQVETQRPRIAERDRSSHVIPSIVSCIGRALLLDFIESNE